MAAYATAAQPCKKQWFANKKVANRALARAQRHNRALSGLEAYTCDRPNCHGAHWGHRDDRRLP